MNIVDCRGCSPLSYVKKDYWSEWIQFFDSVKDVFWMQRDINVDGEEPPPDLVGKPPNSVNGVGWNDNMEKWGLRVDDIALIAMGKKDLDELMVNKMNGDSKDGSGGECKVESKDGSITAPSSSTSSTLIGKLGSSATATPTSTTTTITSISVNNEPLSNETTATSTPVVAG